ncbi:alpha/beta hydrolase [Candidatus Entotheonella palauensis]|uniref:alpha/beta hydrolase n=1 Tax=Candidatus Entotheonella palauensis TaxID=93172 RepID=UPI000B7DFD4B|nr:alpha/beta hydrolase [Candidatus Entotheonella palauensis]
MPLDPQAQTLLDKIAAANVPPLHELTIEEARQANANLFITRHEPQAVRAVEDRVIPSPAGAGHGTPIRVYTPQGDGPFPVLVYFHGGGWVVGSLETHDAQCRALSHGASCVVVAVDYRLAPEHKFPAAIEDCDAATQWVAENAASLGGDPDRLAVGGDSAGGNLAAVVALWARDRGTPYLAFQLLIYPATDMHCGTASQQENAEGYLLTRDAIIWFRDQYLRSDADVPHPDASPLLAPSLDDLPPALIITAEFDPLRDEGEAYAARLQAAGVPVMLKRYDGMIHGLFNLGHVLDQGQQVIEDCALALRRMFPAKGS